MPHLELCRSQVGEASAQQVTHKIMNEDSIVWIGSGALGCLIPERHLDDPAVHNGEQVVQDLGMQLEARLVKAICIILKEQMGY